MSPAVSSCWELDSRVEALLDDFIQTKCQGFYSHNNLEMASIWVLMSQEHKAQLIAQEQKFKQELAEHEWQKRLKEVNTWVQSHNTFRQGDEALAVIKDFFSDYPDATITDWDEFTQSQCDNPKIWKQPRSLGIADVRSKDHATT